jgi:HPt (histidine-containing phosphotransfer) domain-containing protein
MIDWNQVEILRNDVGPDAFGEIIDLFLDEVETTVAKLVENPKVDELEDDMHFLKGSALNLGFQQFSVMCQTGETMSADGRGGDVNLPAIIDCFYSSKTAFMMEVKMQN